MRALPVVAAVDGTAPALAAARWAAAEARLRDLPLRLVHVADGDPDPSVLAEALDAAGAPGAEAAVRTGPVVPALLAEAASILVLGTRGLLPDTPGSVSATVAERARCPVVVVPGTSGAPEGPVVVTMDDTPSACAALTWAAERAALTRAPLLALPLHPPPAEPPFQRTAERPLRTVLDQAPSAALLVVGADEHRDVPPGMTSWPAQRSIVRTAPCPVAVIHP